MLDQDRLPEELEQKTVGQMRSGEHGYVSPNALVVDSDRYMWLLADAEVHSLTVAELADETRAPMLFVKWDDDGITVVKGNVTKKWVVGTWRHNGYALRVNRFQFS